MLLMSSLAGCSKQNVDPSSDAFARNDAEIDTYVSQNNLQGKRQPSGLFYVPVLTNPTGKLPSIGEEIEFSYKSFNMLTGQVIDSSLANRPVYYPLGIRAVLPGLEEGLSLTREGERATLLIPSYLGYGAEPRTNLPAYSVVRFDIQVNRSRTEDQQINEYITTNNLTVTETTASGLRFIRTNAPSSTTAPVPPTGATLSVRYRGLVLRSTVPFDSTAGTTTADFVLGQGRYIKGFEEGLAKLRVGDRATIIFPSAIGYGTQGVTQSNRFIITPYAPLRFDLELVSAR